MKDSWSRWFGPIGGWLERLTLLEKAALTTVLTVLGAGWVLVLLGSPAGIPDTEGAAASGVHDVALDEVGDDAAAVDWLDDGSWLDPPGSQEAKRLEKKKRAVEKSILWSRKIRRARISIQRGQTPRFRSAAKTPDTAAVMLDLKPGVDALPPAAIDAIRSTIQHSFNVAPKHVLVTVVSNDEIREAVAGGDEPDLQRSLRAEIIRLCDRVFAPEEYSLAVTVVQSVRSESRETRQFDPDTTLRIQKRVVIEHTPGGLGKLPMTRKIDDGEVLSSVERSVVKIPAGELQAVQVNLLLDLRAVRVLAREGAPLLDLPPSAEPLESTLSAEERLTARFEAFIGNLIPREGPLKRQVRVWAIPFKAAPFEAAPRLNPGELAGVIPGYRDRDDSAKKLQGVLPPKGRRPGGDQITVVEKRKAGTETSTRGTSRRGLLGKVDPGALVPLGIAVALSIAVVGWWLVRWLGRTGLEDEEPSEGVELSGARQAGYHATDLAGEIEAGRPTSALGPLQPRFAEDLLETVDRASASVRERPEMAASVLRLWLAQDTETGDANLE